MNKPNMMFILADDMGHWAMGCAGNNEVRTPNLDRLAASGIRFTDFYCVSPVCSPARASILTGAIPSNHGVHDWIRGGNLEMGHLPDDLRNSPRYADETNAISYLQDQQTYTQMLANQGGYYCALSGKWHLGDSITPQQGFSHWYTIGQGGCKYDEPDMIKDGRIRRENRYVTDLITEDALQVLEQAGHQQQPFYLSVHYTAPHSPWERGQHPSAIYESYRDCKFESVPVEAPHPWQIATCPSGEGERRKQLLAGYYTAITAMDAGIGKLLDKLDELRIADQTLVVFTSDNGMNMGHHGIWGKGNGTFPQNMFDTSVKVPMIVSHPGRLPSGLVSNALLSHYDLYPTLLDYAGIDVNNTAEKPGRSFAPLLQGDAGRAREHVVVYDEYGPVRMIRTEQWKYVHRYPYGPHELYDLKADPDERNNLYELSDPDGKAAELRLELEQWFMQHVDPRNDGVKEPVSGFGQLGRAGAAGIGPQAFVSK